MNMIGFKHTIKLMIGFKHTNELLMIDRCQNFCHHRFHLDDLGRTMVSTLQIIQVRPWGVKTYGDLGIPKFRKPPYWYSNIFYKAQQLDATGLRCQNYWVYVCLTCPKSFFCPPKSTSLKPRSHQNMMARITISIHPGFQGIRSMVLSQNASSSRSIREKGRTSCVGPKKIETCIDIERRVTKRWFYLCGDWWGLHSVNLPTNISFSPSTIFNIIPMSQ